MAARKKKTGARRAEMNWIGVRAKSGEGGVYLANLGDIAMTYIPFWLR